MQREGRGETEGVSCIFCRGVYCRRRMRSVDQCVCWETVLIILLCAPIFSCTPVSLALCLQHRDKLLQCNYSSRVVLFIEREWGKIMRRAQRKDKTSERTSEGLNNAVEEIIQRFTRSTGLVPGLDAGVRQGRRRAVLHWTRAYVSVYFGNRWSCLRALNGCKHSYDDVNVCHRNDRSPYTPRRPNSLCRLTTGW